MYEFPPGTILVVGALLLALVKGRIRGFLSLLLPVLSFLHLLQFDNQHHNKGKHFQRPYQHR